jgi:hypothetical protein
VTTKYTKGPWRVAYDDHNGQAVVSGEHTEVCTCWHHCVVSIEKQMRANARLIAAAPELVEALRASTEWLEAVLAAMDKYNEANGTHIIGPFLLGSGRQVASNRALLARIEGDAT